MYMWFQIDRRKWNWEYTSTAFIQLVNRQWWVGTDTTFGNAAVGNEGVGDEKLG